MADQVKQLAFKKFTVDEIRNGTAVNILTTDATPVGVAIVLLSTNVGADDPFDCNT